MMNLSLSDKKEIVKEMTYSVISGISPEEAAMFDGIFEEYYDNPAKKNAGRDSTLGFGIEGMLDLSTPMVIGMASSVAGFLFTEILKTVKDQTAEAIKAKIKKLFNKKDQNVKKSDLPDLTPEQYAIIKKIAKDEALKFGLSEADAEKMSTGFIGSMNLPAP